MISYVFVSMALQLKFFARGISSMTENEVFIHESVDGVGETTNKVNMNPIGNMLNVEHILV